MIVRLHGRFYDDHGIPEKELFLVSIKYGHYDNSFLMVSQRHDQPSHYMTEENMFIYSYREVYQSE